MYIMSLLTDYTYGSKPLVENIVLSIRGGTTERSTITCIPNRYSKLKSADPHTGVLLTAYATIWRKG